MTKSDVTINGSQLSTSVGCSVSDVKRMVAVMEPMTKRQISSACIDRMRKSTHAPKLAISTGASGGSRLVHALCP